MTLDKTNRIKIKDYRKRESVTGTKATKRQRLDVSARSFNRRSDAILSSLERKHKPQFGIEIARVSDKRKPGGYEHIVAFHMDFVFEGKKEDFKKHLIKKVETIKKDIEKSYRKKFPNAEIKLRNFSTGMVEHNYPGDAFFYKLGGRIEVIKEDVFN